MNHLNPFNWELDSKVRHVLEGLVYGAVAVAAAKEADVVSSGDGNPAVVPVVVALLLFLADWARAKRREVEQAEAVDDGIERGI